MISTSNKSPRRNPTRRRQDDAPPIKRRRQLLAFLVLAMLLYGRHSSVAWSSQRRFSVRKSIFARACGIPVYKMERYFDWLRKNRYLTDLSYRHGYIDGELAPVVDRAEQVARHLNEDEEAT